MITKSYPDQNGDYAVLLVPLKNQTTTHTKLCPQLFESKPTSQFVSPFSPKETQSCNITFDKLLEEYKKYKKHRVRESTYIVGLDIIRLLIAPFFAHKKISEICKKDIIDWQDYVSNKISKKTGEKYSFHYKSKAFAYLINIFNYAEEYFNIKNPATKIKNFINVDKKKEMQIWSEKEFLQFIFHVDNLLFKAFFAFLYLTGTRKSEAIALEWQDINFEKMTVKINKTLTNKTKNGSYKIVELTKSPAGNRTILLPRSLIRVLKELKRKSKSNFVFAKNQDPLTFNTIQRTFKKYCQKSKVAYIRIHDLRHSHVSLLISKGNDIVTIAKRLGHSDVEQTLNTYAHLMPDKQKQLMASLSLKF